MVVKVQTEDFDVSTELRALTDGRPEIGAVVTFTGIVRDKDRTGLETLELEHYPGMTESALLEIEQQAVDRWSLAACLIIHRHGALKLGEQIMMVATASAHRQDAFQSAEFLMDFLKSRAPFWKKETTDGTGAWVDAREIDEAALKRW